LGKTSDCQFKFSFIVIFKKKKFAIDFFINQTCEFTNNIKTNKYIHISFNPIGKLIYHAFVIIFTSVQKVQAALPYIISTTFWQFRNFIVK